MTSFLHTIAENLIQKHGTDLQKIVVFFPNRTGIHFFIKALSESSGGRAIWSPVCMTPGMQMEKASGLIIGNKIQLAAELHRVYQSVLGRDPEPFERFYPWADLLLNDFDDIDKYLADARLLYANLAGLKEINEQFAFLTEEQISLIRRFWRSYEEPRITEPKERFLRIWEKLYDVYEAFTDILPQKGFGYEGLLHRKAVENPDSLFVGLSDVEKVMVVGFNRLNACEKVFFRTLQTRFNTEFYYDEHISAAADKLHEGGKFFRETVALFPPTFPDLNKVTASPDIEIISVTGSTSAVKIAAQEIFTALHKNGHTEEDILLMLPDEKQLNPLIYSIPEGVAKVNITSGLSLAETPLVSLVKLLYSLRKSAIQKPSGIYFRVASVLKVLRHPYLNFGFEFSNREITDRLTREGRVRPERKMLGEGPFYDLLFALPSEISFHQYITRILQSVLEHIDKETYAFEKNILQSAIESAAGVSEIISAEQLPENDKSVFMLMNTVLRGTRIPFEGKPVEGLQIMGPLETRNLDFKTVIIPAMADDQFPGSGNPKSYIPFALRKAFGMPLPEDRSAELSHIFFRLLNRAEKVVLICNTSAGALSTGEPSRFILRLEADPFYSPLLTRKTVNEKITFRDAQHIEISKSEEVIEKLKKYTGPDSKRLYPTALNTYLSCSLRFYFRYIAEIKEPEELSEVADYAAFGSVFHNIMEWIYADWVGKEIKPKEVLQLSDKFDSLAERAFKMQFGYNENETFEFEGETLIQLQVIKKYVLRMLDQDAHYAPFTLLGLEHNGSMPLHFRSNEQEYFITLGGNIDRVDKKNGIVRIMDYKTGKDELKYPNLESLFDTQKKNRNKAAFQTWLYGLIYADEHPEDQMIQAGVFSVNALFEDVEKFDPILKVRIDANNSRAGYRNVKNLHDEKPEFIEKLQQLVSELFSVDVPFSQTEDYIRCGTCPYNEICRR